MIKVFFIYQFFILYLKKMYVVFNLYGIFLQCEGGCFVVYMQEGKDYIVFDQVWMILVSKGAKISLDVVLLAIEYEIDLMFVDGKGLFKGWVWSVKYGFIVIIWKNQLEFIFSLKVVDWVKQLLVYKMDI